MTRPAQGDPFAVIGMALRVPGAAGLQPFLRSLAARIRLEFDVELPIATVIENRTGRVVGALVGSAGP